MLEEIAALKEASHSHKMEVDALLSDREGLLAVSDGLLSALAQVWSVREGLLPLMMCQ